MRRFLILLIVAMASGCVPVKHLMVEDRYGVRIHHIKAPDDTTFDLRYHEGHWVLVYSSEDCVRCHGKIGMDVTGYGIID